MGAYKPFGILIEVWGEGAVLGMASPIDVLHSRQKRPLFQDDSLRRGEFAPRVFRGIWTSGNLVMG
jgi:hypothetical protein